MIRTVTIYNFLFIVFHKDSSHISLAAILQSKGNSLLSLWNEVKQKDKINKQNKKGDLFLLDFEPRIKTKRITLSVVIISFHLQLILEKIFPFTYEVQKQNGRSA